MDTRKSTGTRFNILVNEIEVEPIVLIGEKPTQEGKIDKSNGYQLGHQGKKSQNVRQVDPLGPATSEKCKAHEKSDNFNNQKPKRTKSPKTSISKPQVANSIETQVMQQAKEKLKWTMKNTGGSSTDSTAPTGWHVEKEWIWNWFPICKFIIPHLTRSTPFASCWKED